MHTCAHEDAHTQGTHTLDIQTYTCAHEDAHTQGTHTYTYKYIHAHMKTLTHKAHILHDCLRVASCNTLQHTLQHTLKYSSNAHTPFLSVTQADR